MRTEAVIAVGVPVLMIAVWLVHIAVVWHWDFKAWYHASDNDI